jgi:hypothetical protein
MSRLACRAAVVLLTLTACGGCGGWNKPAAPEVQPDVEVLSGPQRIEWDQPALSGTDVASYRFVLHVDGVEKELAATCGELLQSGSHLCSADLPELAPGRHVLALAAMHEKDGKRFESRRSLSLELETR